MIENIKINSEGFASTLNSFEKNTIKVQELLKEISNTMRDIDGTNETWKSRTALAVNEGFKESEQNFETINEQLKKYVDFLKTTLENYKTEEEKLNNSIDSESNNLDVNE